REKLNSDPLQLQNEIIQAQKSYGELGFSMEGVSRNADGLIAAYQRLRTEMSNKLPDLGLQEILVTQQKLIALQERQAEKAKLAQPYTAVGSADSLSIAEGFGFSGTPETRDPNGRFRTLGPAFNSAMDMVANPSLIDAKDPLGSTAAVRAQMVAARQEMFNSLVAERSKPVGQQDQGVIRGFVEQLNLSNEALKLFAETAGQAVSIQSENVKLERQMAQNRVDLMRTSPEFGAFDRTLRDLEKERASDQGRVLGDKSLDGRARMEALMGALGSTSGKAKSELDRLNTYRDQLIGEGKDPVEVDTALAEIKGKLDQVAKNATKELRELVDAIKPEAVLVAQAERRANDAQIAALTRSASLQRDQDELRRIEERGRALIEVNASLSRDILTFGKTPEQIASDTGLKDQLDQLNRETEGKLQRFSDDFVQRRRQLEDAALRLTANTEKAKEADLRAEASRLEKIANDARTTPDKARELVEQINKLLDEAKQIATRRIDIETQREVATAPSGPLPNYTAAPPGSVAAQVIEGSRAAGRSDMVNYLLGLGTLESSLNPNATNASGAKGLFQFMNNTGPGGVNTWGRYGKGSIFDVGNQVNAAIDFTRDNDALFRSRLGRDPTDAERFVLHNQGGAGGTRLLRNPNDLARNYVSDAAIENNGGKGRSGDITAREFTDILKRMYEDAARRAGGYTTDAKTVLGQKRDAEVGRLDEGDRADRGRINAIAGRKDDTALLAGLKLDDKTDTAKIAAALTRLATANEVGTVQQGSTGITETYGRLRDRALREDALDVNSRSRTPEQKSEAEAEITERFRALAERGAIAAADAAGKVSVRVLDQEIERAEARLKALQLDRNENKVSQDQVDAEAKRLSVLKEQRGLEGENGAIKAQILVLEKALADAAAAGLGPAEKQLLINEKLVELKRRQGLSDDQVKLQQTLNSTTPSIDNAISGAVNDFEKSRGIRDPLGDLVGPTQQARKLLAAELSVVGNAFDSFFVNLFSGSMKAGDALKKFATDILGGLMSQISKSLTNDIFKSILGGGSDTGGGFMSIIGSIFGGAKYMGGPILRRAGGGSIPGSDAALRDRDSQLILAQPDEYLLRKSAVDFIGRDTLDQVNALGGKMVSRAPQVSPSTRFGGASATTSVYVVDRDQVPTPGPNEMVYAIGENIRNQGTIAQLIKRIQVGG
ncbi:transglycosylase SLT domain-containing protein, partial [Methylorubrum suomiense]